MRFLVRKRRNAPTVIIVALVDVLIVLLIFLMVTTTFRQQPTLKLQLPESSAALKEGVTPNEPPFIVNIMSNAVVIVDRNPIPFDNLEGQLQKAVTKNPQLELIINADRNAPFYRIVGVMDLAKKLKIKSVKASTKDSSKP